MNSRRNVWEETQQAERNEFKRNYCANGFLIHWNKKTYELKNGLAHEEAVNRVCYALAQLNIAFATEVRMKCKNVADIICPNHPYQIIEVMSTETDNYMAKKLLRYPEEVRKKIKVLKTEEINSLKKKDLVKGGFLL